MGSSYPFTCPAYHYQVEVSGQGDAGMMVVTETVVCFDCKKLYDVVTRDLQKPLNEGGRPLRCPKSKKHRVAIWKDGDGCPKCGAVLRNDGETMLWD
jgi:hypothetical protein